jgi:hypothetical protein
VGEAVGLLFKGETWIRVGLFVAGGVLILGGISVFGAELGVLKVTPIGKLAKTVAGAVK